jgi:ABC-2 type transport system permease protein
MSSFSTIVLFEIKQWFRRPSYYIYLSVMFLLALFLMADSAGIFDAIAVSVNSATLANSPSAINGLLNLMNVFIFFLLPALMGGTIYKDFKHEMHSVLFSYPFSKSSYLLGKFIAGYTATMGVLLAAALGMIIGTLLPGTNPDLIAPFQLSSYVQSFWMYLIPNTFFLGAFVFAIVTFTRSISVGFLSVLGLIIVQSIADTLLTDLDNKILSALLDPFGYNANLIYTEYWTVYEQNENPLPWEQWVIANRILWSLIGSSIFGLVFAKFEFHQQALQIKWPWAKKGERLVKNNFGVMGKIVLPKASLRFSTQDLLRRFWVMGRKDLIYIISGWPFIIIVIMAMILSLITITTGSEIYGTQTLPVTWQMLELPGTFFGLFINLLTFLYAGMVLQRDHTTGMASLLHSTPIPTWMILGSKLLALSLMQFILLGTVMAMGIGIQTYQGYYHFELGLYIQQLFGIQFIHLFIWSLFALFIHTLFKNYFVGFFVLLLVSIGLSFSSQIGLEQLIFKFNQAPPTPYSDMNGYGHYLSAYFSYKLYWLALAIALYILALWLYPRGSYPSWKERFSEAKKRVHTANLTSFAVSLVLFLSLGSYIYYVDNIKYERQSSKEQEASQAEWEKTYGHYKRIPQPRIKASFIEMDLFPKERNLDLRGRYTLVNKTNTIIDSIHIDHGNLPTEFSFSEPFERVLEDTVFNYDIFQLTTGLAPGDSVHFHFRIYNNANEWLRNNSPVLTNGTFLNNGILPRIGYNAAGELIGNESREKFGLAPKDRMPNPTDSLARMNNYISYDADWIDFETILSTSTDQIAIAPGYLKKEWVEGDRRYFHYKMDSPILNFYSFISAQFEVEQDYWLRPNGDTVSIEVYHHPSHDFNIERMIDGVKEALDYSTQAFSPYQHRQVRIIEFPRTSGGFAQSFANTIPYSEAIGFIAAVDEEDEDGVDYPFSVSAHEVAHQWWAHQVIGANAKGATLMSESMSEYVSLKVLEKRYGEDKMRIFLKDALDRYLTGRAFEGIKERPLMYNENQQYIHYNKGSLVLYALSDYLSEDRLNKAIKNYVQKVAFQEAPYTVASEFVEEIETATPDSLAYLIDDLFRTITLYDNRVEKAEWWMNSDSLYEVELNLQTVKYRSDEKGKRIYTNAEGDSLILEKENLRRPLQSLPLKDYIDVGIFTQDHKGRDSVLYLQKHRFQDIETTLRFTLSHEPSEVGIDPFNKLIDTQSMDNRREIIRRERNINGLKDAEATNVGAKEL